MHASFQIRNDEVALLFMRYHSYVFQLQEIVTLDLRSNKIEDKGAKYIADALENNTVSNTYICLLCAFYICFHVDSSRT
jgi:Ran GTPase-activating protein (RanGAP) involved in mRNA processing and transport